VREYFRTIIATDVEREILAAADSIVGEMTHKPTIAQIRQQLIDDNVVCEEDVPEVMFRNLMVRALWAGLADWDICPDDAPPETGHFRDHENEQTQANGWVFSRTPGCSVLIGNLVQSTTGWGHSAAPVGPWSPWQIRLAATRLKPAILSGRAHMLLVRNDSKFAERDFNQLKAGLVRILEVRIARQRINEDAGKEIWPAAGRISDLLPSKSLTGRARAALNAARQLVNAQLNTTLLLPPDGRRWDQCSPDLLARKLLNQPCVTRSMVSDRSNPTLSPPDQELRDPRDAAVLT
jgi:hypothetical protein